MIKRQFQHLLESIVNSTEKQEGQFKETAALACRLLSQSLAVETVGVCLFDLDNDTSQLIAQSDESVLVPRPAPSRSAPGRRRPGRTPPGRPGPRAARPVPCESRGKSSPHRAPRR